MAANRNTGLMVIKDDTILAERYNYDRKPDDRFALQLDGEDAGIDA